MKIFKVIRSAEWWAHKLPPLLAIGYATVLMSAVPLYRVSLWLVFLLASLVVGAIYVSVINDITDLEEDLASGKPNRIQQIPEKLRWTIPVACIFFGTIFGYFLYPDLLSCLLYLLSWIVFSLYSIRPVRLKNRGILGVFADGCGSHLFPSLLMVSSVSYITHQEMNWVWFASVGVWAFCYGLRGILWHQFADRVNDIKVNLNTYASKIEPQDFKKQSMLLITLELIALSILLTQLALLAPYIALLLYLVLLYLRYTAYKNQIVLIIKPNSGPFQILMADYYQMFFPISLLVFASITDNLNFIALIVHMLLFPYLIWLAIYDYARIIGIKILQLTRK
ncbi:UbiA family prenyltransferase [Pedobacter heparinus]|uniref:UbiA prenyltransferase n=1 Tax=Pedobacter heparinus (strain ATCC 13125 / DSM 2366 / CIP 104194 / JCM 7457 / NBRC 12017 / NCIMB 9290 / NRRL B-14731 / HIM 762-3) TaxID=485917 RepID=C6XWT0_PEDHD|nr:UbiA family prenyltransferase [Pedobacter heparinus]ACU04224.1 UbiA prenyltransferase [Pedobacter heparinus DSM 2366]